MNNYTYMSNRPNTTEWRGEMTSFVNDKSETSSENDMESLFHIIEEEDEIFSFDAIHVQHLVESEELEVTFVFSMNHRDKFESKVYMKISGLNDQVCSGSLIRDITLLRILFSQGMCILHWFWMGFATSKIELSVEVSNSVQLNHDMLLFWKEVYVPMIAEFLYVNRIPNKLVLLQVHPDYVWPSEGDADKDEDTCNWRIGASSLNHWKARFSVIVPLGGGKDSLVVWQLAREQGERPLSVYVSDGMFEFSLNTRLPAIVQHMQSVLFPNSLVTDESEASGLILVKHIFMDEEFRRLSRSYCEPCGHPWAAVVLFDSLLVGYLLDIPRISLGFEKSADEGNRVFVAHNTVEVNHQYDKSQPFLALTQSYITKHITDRVQIGSVLHDMWELEIARIFCTNPALERFHSLFLSCNEPAQHVHWCARCDKCAFIFLLLAAWKGVAYVTEVVFEGNNLLQNPALIDRFLQLLDDERMKPFDCVGTASEARDAVHLLLRQYTNQKEEDTDGVAFDAIDAIEAMPIVLQALTKFVHTHPSVI